MSLRNLVQVRNQCAFGCECVHSILIINAKCEYIFVFFLTKDMYANSIIYNFIHLYLSGVWLDMHPRMDTKKMCSKEVGLCA
jgi:hypothetical protein